MKKSMQILGIAALSVLLVFTAALPFLIKGSPTPEPPEPSDPPSPPATEPVPPTEPPTPPATEPSVEPPHEPEAPEEMVTLLEEAGLELEELDCSQLIIVKSSGSEAQISAYGLDGDWQKFAPTAAGHVGKNGVSADKVEGDKKTPAGLFPITGAFGNNPDPGCKLPYRQATEHSFWVDDPGSALYNQWVEDEGDRDWTSAERIADRVTSYAYAAIIGYNMNPVVPGAGSAIFLHIGQRPTTGCVSLDEDRLLELLLWLDPELKPKILIF